MQTVRDKAAALRSGGGAAGWAPVLIAMCSIGCCFLVIALVIILSLIPTMVTDDTVAAKTVTSKTSSVTTAVADARRKRVTTYGLENYIGDQVGPTGLSQIKTNWVKYLPTNKHIRDIEIESCSLGYQANTDSTMILTCLYKAIYGDNCGSEDCQTAAGTATRSAFQGMPASVFTLYSVAMYSNGVLAGYATVLRGSKIIFVSPIYPWYSSHDAGASPATKAMTTASMTTASG
ncbi:unnamed protein product [Adineta steineri]|uniref:Uncharacterized protein n=1 Tax=Adineta steineri TaxID=433720 RepID=A0A818HBP0_9BILA|nr:unnamed protein product [Adineta steineri]CAF3505959.1 unnamed protein product [Adineta steineri]